MPKVPRKGTRTPLHILLHEAKHRHLGELMPFLRNMLDAGADPLFVANEEEDNEYILEASREPSLDKEKCTGYSTPFFYATQTTLDKVYKFYLVYIKHTTECPQVRVQSNTPLNSGSG